MGGGKCCFDEVWWGYRECELIEGVVGCEGEEELYTRFESGGAVMDIDVTLEVRNYTIPCLHPTVERYWALGKGLIARHDNLSKKKVYII